MQSLAIVIADVDAILTEYLSSMLERNGHRVLISVPSHAAVRDAVAAFHPDLCLLDLSLRDGDDLAHVQRLTTEHPSTAVVIRTREPSSEQMQAALAAGAVGYVHKSRGAMVLLDVITRVADDEIVIEGTFVRTAGGPDEAADEAYVHELIRYLTPRERECLILLGEGKGTRAIADCLGVSTMTVRSHVQALLGKLGVHSRLEAATIAMRCNLVSQLPARPAARPRIVGLPTAATRTGRSARAR